MLTVKSDVHINPCVTLGGFEVSNSLKAQAKKFTAVEIDQKNVEIAKLSTG